MFAEQLKERGNLSGSEQTAIETEVTEEVAAAQAFAERSPVPEAVTLYEDVFA
jgi:TPP-dependent pyruvate/acetoin dehydrogenase alpha subunit